MPLFFVGKMHFFCDKSAFLFAYIRKMLYFEDTDLAALAHLECTVAYLLK